MFSLFKKKLKDVVASISTKIEKEAPEEEKEVVVSPPPEPKRGFFSALFKKKEAPQEPEPGQSLPQPPEEPKKVEPPVEQAPPQPEQPPLIKKPQRTRAPVKHPLPPAPPQAPSPEPPPPKSFFQTIKEKIVTKRITEEAFADLFSELELALMENNTAIDVIDNIKNQLKEAIVDHPIPRGKVLEHITTSLKTSISSLFPTTPPNLLELIRSKKEKPYVILFVGVNGSGKTTTIAKVAHFLKHHHFTPVLAAADTFRAGSIAQLESWAKKIGVKLIKHDYGSDPAAVCYDAIDYAKKQHLDVVLIDTAGRQHTNINLVRQMEKIVRVAQPDLKLFVGESITGNDCIIQAEEFNEAITLDGIILTKADVDEKGGTALSVTYVTGKPIFYLGTGQELDALEPFNKETIIHNLGL